jgi:hypothetical protein
VEGFAGPDGPRLPCPTQVEFVTDRCVPWRGAPAVLAAGRLGLGAAAFLPGAAGGAPSPVPGAGALRGAMPGGAASATGAPQ